MRFGSIRQQQQQRVCIANFQYSRRMDYVALAQVLTLLALANGSPVIAKRIFGENYAAPVDGKVRFIDGRPLVGPSKTIRGIVISLMVTTLGAILLGLFLLASIRVRQFFSETNSLGPSKSLGWDAQK